MFRSISAQTHLPRKVQPKPFVCPTLAHLENGPFLHVSCTGEVGNQSPLSPPIWTSIYKSCAVFASWTDIPCARASRLIFPWDSGCPDTPAVMKTFQKYLPSSNRTYSCIHCRANLALHDDLISKSFQGAQGRAYLFNNVVNVACGQAEERVLLTGLHAVADIYCGCCKRTLGWKYEHAYEISQKYKEGKYVIELFHMIKDNGWDIAAA